MYVHNTGFKSLPMVGKKAYVILKGGATVDTLLINKLRSINLPFSCMLLLF
jgi:hypothetical protein